MIPERLCEPLVILNIGKHLRCNVLHGSFDIEKLTRQKFEEVVEVHEVLQMGELTRSVQKVVYFVFLHLKGVTSSSDGMSVVVVLVVVGVITCRQQWVIDV